MYPPSNSSALTLHCHCRIKTNRTHVRLPIGEVAKKAQTVTLAPVAGQLPHFPAGQLPEWDRGHLTIYRRRFRSSEEEYTTRKTFVTTVELQ